MLRRHNYTVYIKWNSDEYFQQLMATCDCDCCFLQYVWVIATTHWWCTACFNCCKLQQWSLWSVCCRDSKMRRRRRQRCFLLAMISAVFYVTFFTLIMTFTQKSMPPTQPFVVDDEIVHQGLISSEVSNRNSCVSSSLDVPVSFVGSGCLLDSCSNITCDKLFVGDLATISAARLFQRKPLSDNEVHTLASDCSRLWYLGEYRMNPVRAADVDFPIAFTVLLHLNAEQFERLLRAIYRPQNIYCVHVDTKSPESFQSAIKAIVSCFHNVFLATHLHHVVYAGPSRLQVCWKFDDLMLS